ncbi:hypothetical protein HDZ31DRAFT_33952 [Schizophyllum fasciatum]
MDAAPGDYGEGLAGSGLDDSTLPQEGAGSSAAPPSGSTSKKAGKIHPCTVCDKIFTRPSALETHMNIHSNSKPFLCKHPGCDAAFSVRSNMKRHRRTHSESFHDEMEVAEKAQSTATIFEEPIVAEESCPAGSTRKVNLQWMTPNTVSRNAKPAGNGKGA